MLCPTTWLFTLLRAPYLVHADIRASEIFDGETQAQVALIALSYSYVSTAGFLTLSMYTWLTSYSHSHVSPFHVQNMSHSGSQQFSK